MGRARPLHPPLQSWGNRMRSMAQSSGTLHSDNCGRTDCYPNGAVQIINAGRWRDGGKGSGPHGKVGRRQGRARCCGSKCRWRRAGWLHEGRMLLHCEHKQWTPRCYLDGTLHTHPAVMSLAFQNLEELLWDCLDYLVRLVEDQSGEVRLHFLCSRQQADTPEQRIILAVEQVVVPYKRRQSRVVVPERHTEASVPRRH